MTDVSTQREIMVAVLVTCTYSSFPKLLTSLKQWDIPMHCGGVGQGFLGP